MTISNSGYPGYFLIVQDFIAKAREMDVSVGPVVDQQRDQR
jgi:DNA polymerase-3 subunit alpha